MLHSGIGGSVGPVYLGISEDGGAVEAVLVSLHDRLFRNPHHVGETRPVGVMAKRAVLRHHWRSAERAPPFVVAPGVDSAAAHGDQALGLVLEHFGNNADSAIGGNHKVEGAVLPGPLPASP